MVRPLGLMDPDELFLCEVRQRAGFPPCEWMRPGNHQGQLFLQQHPRFQTLRLAWKVDKAQVGSSLSNGLGNGPGGAQLPDPDLDARMLPAETGQPGREQVLVQRWE